MNTTKDFKDKELPQRKLTREEIRERDRISEEVKQVYRQATGKFLSFFINCDDPEGPAVQELISKIDAQWRVFCKHKNLKTEGYPAIREYCKGVIQQYKAEKKSGAEVVEETMTGQAIVQE
jgi:hypothetical protein